MQLNGRQKRHLRSLGQKLPAAVAVGKAGLTAALIEGIDGLLARQELVKVRLAADSPGARRQRAEELAQTAGAALVGSVGRTVLLYRPNPDLPAGERIRLPEQ